MVNIDLKIIEEANQKKDIYIWKYLLQNTPSLEKWLKVVSLFASKDAEDHPDATSIMNDHSPDRPFLSQNLRVRFWTRLTLQLYDYRDDLENHFEELVPISNWVRSVYGPKIFTNTFGFISFIENRGAVGLKHSDTISQFQWQCHGETIWRTGENLENEYCVKPGDFLYVPQGMDHEIETIGAPRAAINFAIRD